MAGGLDEGFEEYVAVELPRLLGLAHALTGNPHDAWDLAQEALVRVGGRWSRLRDGNPGGYAWTILVRLNVDRVRRLRRETPAWRTPELPFQPAPAWTAEPWLLDALGQLSPRQRTAIVLRFVLDLDVAGIATEMRCSEGTAKSHLSRGAARLRQAAAGRPGVPAGED